MAGKNQVTLTLAGDATKLEKAFGDVGVSAKKAADNVGASSKKIADDTTDAFDKAGEAADNVDTKAMGFRDTVTGIQDTTRGLRSITLSSKEAQDKYNQAVATYGEQSTQARQAAQQLADSQQTLGDKVLLLGTGVGDLASGFYNLIIPLTKVGLGTIKNTIAMGAQKAGMIAGAVATNAMAIAQGALNIAMRLNPIGLVITAIALLVAGFIIAYKKSDTFRAIVQSAMRGVVTAFNWVVTAGGKVWDFFKFIGPRIGGALKSVAGVITAPFRAAFAAVRSAWNNTIGGKGFDIPSWVPEIGGKSFRIPYFHTGGVVSGGLGSETMAVLKAGERVTGGRNGGGDGVLVIRGDGEIARTLLRIIARQATVQGGAKVVFDL